MSIRVGINKLDIFIMKQFLLLFAGAFFICLFILMMQFVWLHIETLIGKGLTLDVLGQFFWYMSLMFIPQALPLAILLSSLITFGNLGESSELIALKAAGISLMQIFRGMIIFVIAIACLSFYFQNVVTPSANRAFGRLLISMKQTNPELEIPEGVFYDGIPNCNVYVQKKDLNRGMLYGIMIYRISSSFEDAAIILADSGSLAMTEEKQHLVLNLYSGEWFENMQHSDVSAVAANVPYRRETFERKDIIIEYNGDFNLADEDVFAHDAKTKSFTRILHDIDSMNISYDSLGISYYSQEKSMLLSVSKPSKEDSIKNIKRIKDLNLDKKYSLLPDDKKREVISIALDKANMANSDMEFKSYVTEDNEYYLRKHKIEAIAKFTLALSCLIFFFIGAPLGAIIRKGGLGMPLVVSVLVFIVYFIFENMGTKMAREGSWPLWFGCLLSTVILSPLSIFFTYKANNDSAMLNADFYRELMHHIFGIKPNRFIPSKEVIINSPEYEADAEKLKQINTELQQYAHEHKLYTAPNIIKVFFRTEIDRTIIGLNERLEAVIDDLSNTRDRQVLYYINHLPVIATDSHTAPFANNKWNIIAGCLIPIGIFLYFRIWRFRLTLLHDIRLIRSTNEDLINRIEEIINSYE